MSFLDPFWFILLITLPALVAVAVLTAHLRGRRWDAFLAPRLRSRLLKRASSIPRWFSLLFLVGALAALIIAFARPIGDGGTESETARARDIIIALDISRSMRATDVSPDRLAQAKIIAHDMIEALPGDRFGLIAFAGHAYLYAPLTVDHSAVRETIDQIDETWATRGGSNLADAIRIAVETFREAGNRNSALVILSDGEENTGDSAAMINEAERAGMYIFAIAIGTEQGGQVPHPDYPNGIVTDRNGNPLISKVETEVLRELATATRGRFALSTSGFNAPDLIRAAVSDLDSFEIEGRERTITIEFFQWFTAPAMFFLFAAVIAGTRWRGFVGTLDIPSRSEKTVAQSGPRQ